MATAKRKTSPPKVRRSLSKLAQGNKLTSLIAAVVFIAIFSTIGVKYLQTGHAQSGSLICMNLYQNECFASHDPYNAITVSTGPISSWQEKSTGSVGGGYPYEMFQNTAASNHCLKADSQSPSYLTVGSTSRCSGNDSSDLWDTSGVSTGTLTLYNVSHNCYAAVDQYKPINGQKVQCIGGYGNPPTGWDWHWVVK